MEEPIDKPYEEETKEMGFLDHLEEFRWHIIRSLVAVIVVSIATFVSKKWVFDSLIFGPSKPDFFTYKVLCKLSNKLNMGDILCIKAFNFQFINTEMAGQFLVHIKVSLVFGFILAFPYVFWEMWKFVKPALYDKEVKHTRGVIFFSSLLFLSGVLFGYYVLLPVSINFFASYGVSDMVGNSFMLSNYVTFITMIVMATGIMFELPMVVYFLSKVGLITPQFMRTYRKHAFVAVLAISAIITPPDVATQIIVTLPVMILYEASIFISKRVNDNVAEDFE